ncbi:hypothetical protein PSEUBRA_000061 [Kalmanozyma brasiliensis GHG001]|uniref:Uncharacterized protein n=1 Tax=Kalmanozyma brasiliensis (strain GHG001) TaxID=1365824 RepID=V5GUU7_KALBG|nr:uncharacterized protein PSEUBRA_000061 [Kalmanozyma brasiliensis GHG001]EST09687.1 hypothetical protein PSEUBRA_000061 [Kalmanozyma brasiliensis GHG001]
MSYYCSNGNYYSRYPCNRGLGYGSRIGIGVAIAVGVLLLVILFSLLARKRRRRFAQQNASTIPMYQNNQTSNYGQGYGGGYQPSPYGQQPNTYTQHSYGQQGQAYGPPAGAPPARENDDGALYAPPPGAPPPAYVPGNERKAAESANV